MYLQRADRPCRYAAAGCTELAITGGRSCREHHRADVRRAHLRAKTKLKLSLAGRQDWTCPWCHGELPEDVTGVHIDHIIPKASGVVVEDDWNLQALHAQCNISKAGEITERALKLATDHGITLVPVT